jgi:ectoine hydroxylase-related dioxygenase (phytanoyl-CoA dioxygenase family)
VLPERFSALPSATLEGHTGELLRTGFCILRGAAPAELILEISENLNERFAATPFCIGDFHGERTKRFHRLIARAPAVAELITHPQVLASVHAALGQWCDFPEINLTQGVEIHPGAPAQIPHSDQSMWPIPKGSMELCVNVFWPFCDFTPENGATRVWPDTHHHLLDRSKPLGEPKVCSMEPGDALILLGSTVHAAGANIASRPRRAAIVSYCLGWLKAYENQSLAYDVNFVRGLEPELAAMLGYRWHRPNLGTYDGQCPSVLLAEDPAPDHLATIDALALEHQLLVARFAAEQRRYSYSERSR